jgi:hypothetical protein
LLILNIKDEKLSKILVQLASRFSEWPSVVQDFVERNLTKKIIEILPTGLVEDNTVKLAINKILEKGEIINSSLLSECIAEKSNAL